MQIECSRHIDSSGPDESGVYDYHYEYDIYCFTDDTLSLIARSYIDEPDEAHFLSVQTHGHWRNLVDADWAHHLFHQALSYLRSEGKTQLRWLSGRANGYESVPVGP